jgi:hypothetical protein
MTWFHGPLFAAAPDLLEASEDALDSLEYVQNTHGESVSGWGVRAQRIEKAKAAINKACGPSAIRLRDKTSWVQYEPETRKCCTDTKQRSEPQ